MSTLTITKLTSTVGAEVTGLNSDQLAPMTTLPRPSWMRWRTTEFWSSPPAST